MMDLSTQEKKRIGEALRFVLLHKGSEAPREFKDAILNFADVLEGNPDNSLLFDEKMTQSALISKEDVSRINTLESAFDAFEKLLNYQVEHSEKIINRQCVDLKASDEILDKAHAKLVGWVANIVVGTLEKDRDFNEVSLALKTVYPHYGISFDDEAQGLDEEVSIPEHKASPSDSSVEGVSPAAKAKMRGAANDSIN